jgi:hypothetical protein
MWLNKSSHLQIHFISNQFFVMFMWADPEGTSSHSGETAVG